MCICEKVWVSQSVCVCVYAHLRVYAHLWACVCVCVCVRTHVCVCVRVCVCYLRQLFGSICVNDVGTCVNDMGTSVSETVCDPMFWNETLNYFCYFVIFLSHYWVVQWSWFAWVNVLCNLSRKMSREVAASLLGRFLCRHCFMLCIKMEAEPRIVKQYKCHHCCSCKNYQEKGMEGGKKCLCINFWLTRTSQVCKKNAFWGIL